jgi:hypothetical protein
VHKLKLQKPPMHAPKKTHETLAVKNWEKQHNQRVGAPTPLGVKRLEALMRIKIEKKGREVNNKTSAPSLQRLKLFFKQYDTDDDGSIDLPEFGSMLAKIGLPNLHESDVQGLFQRFVREGSTSIDIIEFAAHWTDSFIDQGKKVRSITDLPCTRTEHSNRFKPNEQLVHEVKQQWKQVGSLSLTTLSPLSPFCLSHHSLLSVSLATLSPLSHLIALSLSLSLSVSLTTLPYQLMTSAGKSVEEAYDKLCMHGNLQDASQTIVPPLVEDVKHMLRTRFNLAIGREDTLDLMMGIKSGRAKGMRLSWKGVCTLFQQHGSEKHKYIRKLDKFDGPRIGWERLKRILVGKMGRHAVQRGDQVSRT